jgi:hypothetical protein
MSSTLPPRSIPLKIGVNSRLGTDNGNPFGDNHKLGHPGRNLAASLVLNPILPGRSQQIEGFAKNHHPKRGYFLV